MKVYQKKYMRLTAEADFVNSCLSGTCLTLHLVGGQIGKFQNRAHSFSLQIWQYWKQQRDALPLAPLCRPYYSPIVTNSYHSHFLFSTALIPLQKQYQINFRKCKLPGYGIITTSCFLHLFIFSSGFKTQLRRTPQQLVPISDTFVSNTGLSCLSYNLESVTSEKSSIR